MNPTVCITGTTRGIGLEFAKQYAQAGWEVLACARNPYAGPLQKLEEDYPNVSLWELDVCNPHHLEIFTKDLQGKPIDLLAY